MLDISRFLAGHTLAEGTIHKDERLTREGYFMILDAIKAWPEFNLFTGGYVMSRLPPASRQFRKGLEWQWQTLDKCIEGKLDRTNPDFAQYMVRETTEGKKRACWNSWIAPHNLEGFLSEYGGHARQIGGLANGAEGVRERQALREIRDLELPIGSRGSHQSSASQRRVAQCARWHTGGTDDDQLGILLHGLPSAVR